MDITPDDDMLIAAHSDYLRLRNLSPATIYQRRNVLRRLALPVPLAAATDDHLDAWQHRTGHLAVRTRSTLVTHVCGFYRWGHRQGHIPTDPTRVLIRPRNPRSVPHPIGETDLAMAIRFAPDRIRPWLVLAAFAGLRAGEIARLRREQVRERDDPPVLVLDGKGGKQRVVPMNDAVLDALRLGLPTRGPVFRRHDGQPGHNAPWTISHLCNSYLHSLGVAESLHGLRHRFGTRLYALCPDLRMVQEVMGHDSPLTTSGYVAYSSSVAVHAVQRLGYAAFAAEQAGCVVSSLDDTAPVGLLAARD